MLFNTPLIIFKALSKGNNSHNFANPFPIKSFEKYIPLVKQTSCTIILPTPPDAFSLTRLPINIPNAINNIETNIDAIIVNIIFILIFNPNKQATIKNNESCIMMFGINDNIYPKI